MIRNLMLRVLAFAAHLIDQARVALTLTKAEFTHFATTIEIETLREGVAIADNVCVGAGHLARLERRLAENLIERGLARRV